MGFLGSEGGVEWRDSMIRVSRYFKEVDIGVFICFEVFLSGLSYYLLMVIVGDGCVVIFY